MCGCHLWYRRHEIARGGSRLVGVEDRVGHSTDSRHPLHVLVGEMSLTFLFALSQSHIQRFGGNNAAVHLCHSFSGFFWGGEAHKPKAFAAPALHHHLQQKEELVIIHDAQKQTGPK